MKLEAVDRFFKKRTYLALDLNVCITHVCILMQEIPLNVKRKFFALRRCYRFSVEVEWYILVWL